MKRLMSGCLLALSAPALGGLHLAAADAAAGVYTTVSGKVVYRDVKGKAHPARSVVVDLRDQDGTTGGTLLASIITDANGRFLLRASTKRSNKKARMLYVEASATSGQFLVTTDTTKHSIYTMRSAARKATGQAQSVTVRPAASAATVNGAFAIADAMVTGTALKKALGVTGTAPAMQPVRYPATRTAYRHPEVLIAADDAYDWDVILHEYGHHLEEIQLIEATGYGENHTWTESMDDTFPKGKAGAIAWREGLASYLSVAGQRHLGVAALGIPGAGDTTYDDDNTLINIYSSAGLVSLGEANELSIARTLAKLDEMAGISAVVGALKKDRENLFTRALPGLLDAVGAARFDDTNADPAALRTSDTAACHLENNAISPFLFNPTIESVLTEDKPPTLEWEPGGGGAKYRLNEFTVQFWTSNFDTKLYESSPISSTTWTPSEAEWAQIYHATDQAGQSPNRMRIVIKGKNLSAPITGPYKGCSVEFRKAEITVEPAWDDHIRPQAFGTCATFENYNYLRGADRVRVAGRGWRPSTAYTVSLERNEGDHDPVHLGSLTTDADGATEDQFFDVPAMPGGRWQLVAEAGGERITERVQVVVYRCLIYTDGDVANTQDVVSWGGMGAAPAATVLENYYPVPLQARATASSEGDFEGSPYTVPCVNGTVTAWVTMPNLDGDVVMDATRPCGGPRMSSQPQTQRSSSAGLVTLRR